MPLRPCSLLLGILATLVIAPAVRGAAPGAEQGVWHTMPLPGGAQGLTTALQLPRTIEPRRLLPELMRLAYDVPDGRSDRTDEWRSALVSYISLLDEFERRVAVAGARDGLVLERRAPKNVRRNQRSLLEFLGFRVREQRDTLQVELRPDRNAAARLAVLEAAGLTLKDAAARLNSGEPVAIGLAGDDVPLPLSPEFWSREIVEAATPANRLFAAILSTPKLLFVYNGLLSLDTGTLQYMSENPELIRQIRDDSPAAFAAFAGSLTVRDGAVVVPGGAEAREVWADLADASPGEPVRFIRRLFSRNDGRLAMYFDALAHLPAPQRRYALGLHLPPGERRLAGVNGARAFFDANGLVQPVVKPFERRSRATILLAHAAVEPDGRPSRPAYKRFWRAAFDSLDLPDRPERIVPQLAEDGLVDAGWMLRTIHDADPIDQPARARLWLFGSRVFAGVEDRDLPDVLTALRGFVRHEALLLTLERLGIRTPATYAAAVRRATSLMSAGDGRRRALLVGQFQSLLAFVERLRTRRTITVAQAEEMVRSLAALEPEEDRYDGRAVTWLDAGTSRLPGAEGLGLEERLWSLLAGSPTAAPGDVPAPVVSWEGRSYGLDFAKFRRERLGEIRKAQKATSLDVALTVARAAGALRSVSDVEGVGAALATLTPVVPLAVPRVVPGLGGEPPVKLDGDLQRAARDLAKIRRPKDVKKARDVAGRLGQAADVLGADALVSMVYAMYTDRTDADGLQAAALWPHHDFAFAHPSGEQQVRKPWTIPLDRVDAGAGRHIEGSLLGLDFALGSLALQRVTLRPPPRAPSLTDGDRNALIDTVVLAGEERHTDASRAVVMEAIERGRQRVRAAASQDDVDGIAAAAALNGWRRGIAYWSAERRTLTPSLFSLPELYALGLKAPADPPHAWGASVRAATGCLCLRFPEPGAWEQMAGSTTSGWISTQVADLGLRIAEALHDYSLPASLTGGVLAAATYDYVNELQRVHPDDWMSMVLHAQELSPDRIEDYVASLAGRGPLVSDVPSRAER